MSTSDIHETLVDSAKDMIDEFNPNYSKVAARLFIYMLRKKVWGGKNAPKLLDLIKKNSELGFYDPAILENYSKEEINKVDELIDHSRDDQFDYGGMVQLSEKYLVQNRETKEILEGGENRFKYKLPTQSKYQDLVLKRGLIPIKSKLATWVKKTLTGLCRCDWFSFHRQHADMGWHDLVPLASSRLGIINISSLD